MALNLTDHFKLNFSKVMVVLVHNVGWASDRSVVQVWTCMLGLNSCMLGLNLSMVTNPSPHARMEGTFCICKTKPRPPFWIKPMCKKMLVIFNTVIYVVLEKSASTSLKSFSVAVLIICFKVILIDLFHQKTVKALYEIHFNWWNSGFKRISEETSRQGILTLLNVLHHQP